jgi:hypothetical protein
MSHSVPRLPRLRTGEGPSARVHDGVTLVVHAPFGTDAALSQYPDGQSRSLAQHPLLRSLLEVAEQGVNVVALVDRAGEETELVEIEGGRPASLRVTSRWKQDMGSPQTLTGLLTHAASRHPEAAMVLCLEGHGAGFLPDIDRTRLSARQVTRDGQVEWHITADGGAPALPQGSPILPQGSPILPQGSPILPQGSPILPQGSPILPQGSPILPVNHLPMSTYGLGAALRGAREAGVPPLALIHFNNCFNMSVEVLHTVAPHALWAVGYPNYNFFTAGQAYPGVAAKLAASAAPMDVAELARAFALGNAEVLRAKGNHPTLGSAVQLSRLQGIVEALDDLADALLAALRGSEGAAREQVVSLIRAAIEEAQQFDTGNGGSFDLEAPDELTDLLSLAVAVGRRTWPGPKVAAAAQKLAARLKDIKVYGDDDEPWVDLSVRWDFSSPDLAMNIFLPDPLRVGLWDWRSPFYLDVNPDPTQPRFQPGIIDFVQVTDWVDFIIEYHKGSEFKRLRSAAIPSFPVYRAEHRRPPKGDDRPPCRPGHKWPQGRHAQGPAAAAEPVADPKAARRGRGPGAA